MIRKISSAAVLIAVSPAIWAIPIGTTGGSDELVGQAYLSNSGSATEQDFLEEALGLDEGALDGQFIQEVEGSDGESGNWLQVEGGPAGSDLWAFDLSSVGFEVFGFLIKTGAGMMLADDINIYNTFAYLNNAVAGEQYAVIDLSIFGRDRGNVEIEVVSHVSVPEPSVLSLLGAGLIAVSLIGRRRRKLHS